MTCSRSSAPGSGVFERALRKSIRRGLGVVLAAALTLGRDASAQEALISALSIDRSIAPPQNAAVNWAPDRALLGPVQASFGLYAGAQYNDNINASEFAPATDTILRTGINLGLLWPATDNSALHFGTGVGYLQYLEHSANSGLEISPDSALTWQIGFEDATLWFYDQFSYLQQAVQEPALANVVTLPRLDNTVGARMSWAPKQWQLQAGYSYDYFNSPSATDSYLDRDSQYFFTRDAWRFAESTQAGIEASASLTDYLESTQGSSRSLSVGPYGQWQVTQATFATARVGEVFDFLDSSSPGTPGSSLSSYYFGFDINNKPADFFTDSVSIVRETALGINQGSGYVEETAATGSFSLSITPRISLEGSVTYQKGNQPLAAAVAQEFGFGGPFPLQQETITENFEYYGGGPALTWRVTDKLSSHLNYSCWRRASNLPGRAYSQNIVSLNLDYGFW
jgi:hypothetical protein